MQGRGAGGVAGVHAQAPLKQGQQEVEGLWEGSVAEQDTCVAYAGIGIHNPNTDKIISFRGSRRALTEVMGRVT